MSLHYKVGDPVWRYLGLCGRISKRVPGVVVKVPKTHPCVWQRVTVKYESNGKVVQQSVQLDMLARREGGLGVTAK